MQLLPGIRLRPRAPRSAGRRSAAIRSRATCQPPELRASKRRAGPDVGRALEGPAAPCRSTSMALRQLHDHNSLSRQASTPVSAASGTRRRNQMAVETPLVSAGAPRANRAWPKPIDVRRCATTGSGPTTHFAGIYAIRSSRWLHRSPPAASRTPPAADTPGVASDHSQFEAQPSVKIVSGVGVQ